MKALVKAKAEPGLWLQDIPEPTIGINDVKIRVHRTGICGTDVHIYDWDEWASKTIPVPMAIGHEFVGEIVEVGSNVIDFKPGELVSGEGHVVCGRCRNCMAGLRHLCANTSGVGVNRPGCFAEYIVLPMTNVWHHRHDIDRDVASIFDPFGNAVHTALSFPVLGEDVLITGAGPIGAMAAAVCRHAGARHVVVTDLNPERLDRAYQFASKLNAASGSPILIDRSTDAETAIASGSPAVEAHASLTFTYGNNDVLPNYHLPLTPPNATLNQSAAMLQQLMQSGGLQQLMQSGALRMA